MTDFLIVITTIDHQEQGLALVRSLVERGLVACGQVGGPIESIYPWNARIEQSTEWTCTLKTHRDCWEQLQAELLALHPYDQPQVVAVPVSAIESGYAGWITASLGLKPHGPS